VTEPPVELDEYDDPGDWESDAHPRMRARAASVRAEGDRKRRLIIGAVAAMIATVALVVGVLQSAALDVDRVEISGVDGARSRAASEALAHVVGDPMISLDAGAIASDLREALPWVRAVEVSKDWPSTVRVAIDASEPILFVRTPSGRAALVDDRGVVIGSTRTPPASLVEVVLGADEPVPPAGDRLARDDVVGAVEDFPAALRAAISRLEVSDDQVRLIVRDPGGAVDPGADGGTVGEPTDPAEPNDPAEVRAVEWCTLERAGAKASVTTALLASLGATGEPWTTLNVCVPSRPTKR
jgi:cell division protein FtsQ